MKNAPFGPNRTYNNLIHDLFSTTHVNGAKRHPAVWLKANEIAAKAIRLTANDHTDVTLRAVASLVTLHLLDWLRPVGVHEMPTDENIKIALNKLPPVVEPADWPDTSVPFTKNESP